MNEELEREAIALVKQYRFALMAMPAVKAFFVKLATSLQWENLIKEL